MRDQTYRDREGFLLSAGGLAAYCREHEVTYTGDAPPQMVEWLESDRSDWPKAPEDFVAGGDA
ncbi:hypothetical protein MCEREM21A_02957 [Sphingomonadaceae bacterium]